MVIFIKKGKFLLFLLAILVVFSGFQLNRVQAISQTIYTPIESTKVLNNPLMGWAPDARWILKTQKYKLVFASLTWSDLEAQKGIYNFSAIETKFNFSYWHQQGVKVIIRVVLDNPSSINHKDIPNWLYNEINGDGIWYNNSYGQGFSPNYENATLLAYHQKLISALGQKYNNSGDIAFIELGSLGHWGEWHTMQATGYTFIPFPSEATANKYVTHYINSFSNKIKLMRRPFNIAKTNNLGLFNDVFGDIVQTDRYLSWINNGYYNNYTKAQQPAMIDFWKKAPSGGEFANGKAGVQYFSDINFSNTLTKAKETHLSWVGPNCPANQPLNGTIQPNMDSFLNTIGYKFVISQVSYLPTIQRSKSASLTITINNKGVAPFYYKWPVTLYLMDLNGNVINKQTSTEDIRNWLPGIRTFSSNLYIPSKTKLGTYKLAISINDPSALNQSVDFANEGKTSSGYFYIGNITVAN
ncbi:MAG: DUF4832 domain-containing protein [Clostridiaceae bacterium]|nr:DUF4832 domain-containing protein [Clostridiaceae bacterium]